MTLRILDFDSYGSAVFADGVSDIAGLDPVSETIWSDFPLVRLRVSGHPPDWFPCGILSICSPTFRNAVEPVAGDTVAFHPVEVEGQSGFSAMQVLQFREIVDRNASVFSVAAENGWIDQIDELVLNPEKDVLICVAKRCYEDITVIGPELFGAIDSLSGVWTCSDREWRKGL